MVKQQSENQTVKPIQERLQESITILNKIKDLGISDTDPGYKELTLKFNIWIKSSEAWQGHIDFVRWNRRAKLLLPIKPGTVAKCDFLHYVF